MDILYQGFEVTIIGMGVVFGVLFVLSLILELFKILFYKEKKDSLPEAKVKMSPEELSDKIIEKDSYSEDDNSEEIAVISAIMSELLEKDQYVVNINRIN